MNHASGAAASWSGAQLTTRCGAVLLGTAVLALSAKFSIPFYPVPMTLQTLAVLLIGALLGPRLGTLAVVAYLAEGAAGLPVFSGAPERGSGLAYMAGPTGGYLVGFVAAAFMAGLLTRGGGHRSIAGIALAMAAASAAVYVPGLLWLGFAIGWEKPVLGLGLWPFLPADALKACIATLVLFSAGRLSRRI